MFVTMSEFHPMYSAEWIKNMSDSMTYAIRMTHDNEDFYLKEYDVQFNKANWTKKIIHAHLFTEKEDATEFIALYLPSRECDIYEYSTMWVI